MNRQKAYGINVLSIVAIIFSIISLVVVIIYSCIRFPNTSNLGFDYMGVMVGILSLLVTILLGWNIYALIDLKQSKGYIDEKLEDYDHEISGGIYQAMGISKFDQEQYYDALFFFIKGIEEQNKSSKQVYTNNLINYILKIETQRGKIKLSQDVIDEYKDILIKCSHIEKRKVIKYIESLTTNTNE